MTKHIVVGISEGKASADPKGVIVTYALGSCVGITLYDPVQRVGGMAHIMLPKSRSATGEEPNPYLYADTGVLALAREVTRLGGRKDRFVAKIAGGANMLTASALLDIGKKNVECVLETFKALGILVQKKSVGGSMGRSFYLSLEDGRTIVRVIGGGEEVL